MSEATDEANAFVAAHRDRARALGEALAELTQDPETFVATLQDGLAGLVDPAYTAVAERVSPDVPADLAVRTPLVDTVQRPVRTALREGSSMSALQLAQRLTVDERRSIRLFALAPLARSLSDDPEQSWQLLRRLGRVASDWVEVDSLAGVWASGVLAEPFRWSELEQLVFSVHPYERRLVGATLATIPHRVPRTSWPRLRDASAAQALDMIRLLMGDSEVMVQKALAWALREWMLVAPDETAALLRCETAIAVENEDGARAWVIREALSNSPDELASALRPRLTGIRRDRSAPSTSIAASRAASFAAALADTDDAVAAQGVRYTRSHA
jgi:hypothetical protein